MASALKVSNLSWGTTAEMLRDAFAQFGEVVDAKLMTDWETGRSRGFGYVWLASSSDAEAAVHSLDGQSLDGRAIRVEVAPNGELARTSRYRSADFDGSGKPAPTHRTTYRGEEYQDDGRVARHQAARGAYRSADFDGSGVPPRREASPPPAAAEPGGSNVEADVETSPAATRPAPTEEPAAPRRAAHGDPDKGRNPFG